MRFTNQLTDDATLEELGERLKRTRLELNLTQAKLAERAGVSRRTVVEVEGGGSVTATALLRLLRGLDLLANLEALVPEPTPSPLSRTTRATPRRRARSSRDDRATPPRRWGDERGEPS